MHTFSDPTASEAISRATRHYLAVERGLRRELAISERRRRLETLDRQYAARIAEQDRHLDDVLGQGRR